jgi:DNA-binding response OmpR family regulator
MNSPSKKRALYLEDDSAWVSDVREILTDIEILPAKTVPEALEIAATQEPEVALVDLGIGGDPEAGLLAVRQLRSRYPTIGILVLTARQDPPSVKQALQLGANEFILKPDINAELKNAVERLLHRPLHYTQAGVKLATLELSNFKGWVGPHRLELGQVNLFLGSNSSGKSSILQSLLLLKQTAESSDQSLPLQVGGPHARHVDLGSFYDIVSAHDLEKSVGLAVSWRSPVHPDRLSLEVEVHAPRGRQRTRRFEFRHGAHKYGMASQGGGYSVFAYATGQQHAGFTSRSPVKCYGFPAEALIQVPAEAVEVMRDLQHSFESLMDKVFYLGPLRERPAREYFWTGDRPSAVGARGDRAVEALLALHRDENDTANADTQRDATQLVASQLSQLGLARDFRLHQVTPRQFEVRLITSEGSAEVGLADVGFGLSQVLPILILGLYAPEGSIILVEQPELHLHPAAQASLGDILLEVARKRRLQFLIETHSEHLLTRLQRRVAEEAWPPEELRLYVCEKGSAGSKLSSLQLNTFGEISNWPEAFFGDILEDSSAISRMAMRRKFQSSS